MAENENNPTETPRCVGRCSQCNLGSVQTGGPSGWRLVASSAATFLLPLAGAAAGAAMGSRGTGADVAGAVAGLIVGAIVAKVVSKFIRPASPASAADAAGGMPTENSPPGAPTGEDMA